MILAEVLVVLVVPCVVWFFLRHKPFMPFRKKINVAEGGQPGQQFGLGQSEADFILASVPGFLCLKDPGGHWLQVGAAYQEIYRLTGINCVGQTDHELSQNPTSDQEALRMSAAKDQEAWDLGYPLSDVRVLQSMTGEVGNVNYEITRTPIFDQNKQRFRLLVTGNPLDHAGRVEPDVFASVFYLSKLPFLLLDSELKTLDSNNAFTSFTGYSKRDAVGKYFVFLDPQIDSKEYIDTINAFLKKRQHQPWAAEAVCHCKNGRDIPIRLMVSRILTKLDGVQQIHYLAYLADIRKQKESEKRLMRIAHYDELTGLPNRALFFEQLTRSLFLAARHKLHSAVIFINLDRFKSVNESLGHQAGNALLKEVASRLAEALRKDDILARFSADEFAIMHLNEKSHEEAMVASSMVSQLVISRLAKSFYLLNQEIYISVSIGIAVFPEDAHNAEVLLKNAEIAMYEAKKKGSNNFHYFQKQYTSKAKDRHQLESSLRRALQRRELLLHYQPQYKAGDGTLCGAEVLIRWLQGGTKMISPYYFIDVAEETGLIIPMGKWILETACKQQKAWMDAGYPLRQVSVNVSARQFMDPHFVETVEGALLGSGLKPEHLELEITESMLIGDPKRIELQLNRFKKMGITIALDDFGTGYSSLAYLKNFPIDVVKIDQSFVRGMTPGSTDARIVCAIIEMGHSLGYKVVAEGVEDEAQFLFLKDKGCDIIQGYYFSKPLPRLDMTRLLGGLSG